MLDARLSIDLLPHPLIDSPEDLARPNIMELNQCTDTDGDIEKSFA